METKKSKIKGIQGSGTWDSPHGLLYRFEIEMENGDVGNSLSKGKDFKYAIGEEVSYEYTPGEYPRIKIVQEKQSFGGGRKSGSPAAFALSYAKDLVVADKLTFEQILPAAEKFYKWLKEKE